MKKYLGILIILFITFSTSACKKISISQKDIYILNKKAETYMNQGDYDNAIARLVCINDLEDNHPEIYYNLGVAYIKKGDFQKAIESLKRALELNSDMTDTYYSLGIAYEAQTDSLIEEFQNIKNTNQKSEIKIQIVQNIQYIYDNYSKYIEKLPDNAAKADIKHQFDYLKDKYKDYLIQE